MSNNLNELDERLASKYGEYTSYKSASSPIHIEYYGDSPANEMQRLLDSYTHKDSAVLDIGCGAGQELCRLGPKVKQGWGIDVDTELLQAARLRAEHLELDNVTFIKADVANLEDLEQLPIPNDALNFVYSQRGPNIVTAILPRLHKEAIFVQEYVGGFEGYPLKEIFGRKDYAAYDYNEQQFLLFHYAELGFSPISIKEYFYECYYRDITHLEAYLSSSVMLSQWRLAPKPYEATRDAQALELYARYNTTPRGIRIRHHHRIFVLRYMAVGYPVDNSYKD